VVQLWERSRAAEILLGLTGLLAFPVAALLLGWLYLSTHASPGRIGFTGELGILAVVGILLAGCLVTSVVHEAIHALAMLLVGHTPRLHFETTPYPLLSLDRQEAPYGRGKFVLVTMAPAVLVTAALIVGVAMGPYAGWLIVPAAFHITACKMDIAYSLVALRRPAGTQCRIGENGLELTEPVDYEVP
jgi:hypothetical protein